MKFVNFFVVILCFGIYDLVVAQSIEEIIKRYVKEAEKYENKGKCVEAINYNYTISKMDTAIYKKNALEKINALFPKCKEKAYQELKGKWQLKEKLDLDYYSNIKFTKFIEIDNNKIVFYDDPNNIVNQINLDENPLSYNNFAGFPSLKLDKEIWSFSVRKVGRQVRLRLIKHIDKNGNLIGRIDDRAAIIDSQEREIAMRKEVNTYYLKMKE